MPLKLTALQEEQVGFAAAWRFFYGPVTSKWSSANIRRATEEFSKRMSGTAKASWCKGFADAARIIAQLRAGDAEFEKEFLVNNILTNALNHPAAEKFYLGEMEVPDAS